MTLRVQQIRGMTEDLGTRLKEAGIDDSAKFLAAAAQPEGRKALAAQLGVDEAHVLELANRADLARVKGIGEVFSDLLEFAGVDTVAELAKRNADNLFAKLQEIGAQHSAKRLPRLDEVKDWVEQAKQLGRGIHY